jgi:hypothetical protein
MMYSKVSTVSPDPYGKGRTLYIQTRPPGKVQDLHRRKLDP